MSKRSEEILLHTTGLNRGITVSRNYYAGGDEDAAMIELVADGMMEVVRKPGPVFPDTIFRATDKGIEEAKRLEHAKRSSK